MSVFAHIKKWQKLWRNTCFRAETNGALFNEAWVVGKQAVPCLDFPCVASANFLCEKVCKNAMKLPILSSVLGKMTLWVITQKVTKLLLRIEIQSVAKWLSI